MGTRIARFSIAAATLYLIGLAGWFVAWATIGDATVWLFGLNSVAHWLFTPVPLVLGVAIAARRTPIAAGAGAAALVGLLLFGGPWLPRPAPAAAAGPILDVLSYNALGPAGAEAGIGVIRAANPDIVGISELNAPLARAIERDLGAEYPFQILDPSDDVVGMGVISRYPLRPTDITLGGPWIGRPQILDVDWEGGPITVANLHALPPQAFSNRDNRTIVDRERQAATLAGWAADHPRPVIVLTDFNAGELNRVTRLLQPALRDAWVEAGAGPGLTWGAPFPRRGRHLPIARIDYVFVSRHWSVAAAEVAPWDGVSDHRPVRARLIRADG